MQLELLPEAQLGFNSQPEGGDGMSKEGETPTDPAWGRNKGNPAETCQASDGKHKDSGSLKGDINMRHVDDATASYTTMWTVQLSAQKILAVVETKLEIDSHVDTYVAGDVIHDHNQPMNVFWCDPKARS